MKKIKFIIRAASVMLIILTAYSSSCRAQSNNEKHYILTDEDAQTIKKIIEFSLIDTVSEELHTNFWKVVKKYGGNPNNIKELGSKEKTINYINEIGISYMRIFYEDALISLQTGRPYESEKRKELNTKLNADRVDKNLGIMKNIANKKPIPYNGQEIIIDETIIKTILRNLEASYILFEYNLDILYSEYYHEQINGIHAEVDTTSNRKASFPGGDVAFVNYVIENFKYPQRCLDYGISGNVLLKFRIDKSGRIVEVSVVEQTPGCTEFNIEAINVLKKSPRWTPGMNKGVLVDSWRELPLNISVDSRKNRKKREMKIR